MFSGIIAGITWAVETIILSIALGLSPFFSTEQAIFLAPFVSTFLHDLFSAIFSMIFNGFKGNLKNVWKAFRTKSGKWVAIAAVIGGPVGMTGYVMAVNYMGPAIGAVASAIFPAIGTILAYIFLKEKMKWYQWIFLLLTIAGVYGLSYSPEIQFQNFWLGILGAMMCSFGWGIEAVILAKSLTDPEVTDEYALQIRQTTSALVYGLVLLPIIKGWGLTAQLIQPSSGLVLPTIAAAGLFATISYLFYYRAIAQIGASKAMALNITYSAWAIIFTVLLGNTSVLTPITVVSVIVVLVCSVFAATDFRKILTHDQKS